jgi:AcrR family transcriptional regulator
MKETILKKAGESFQKFGFKSVTMDDIANDLGISKKTIYKYFKTKIDLVESTVTFIHNSIYNSITCTCNMGYNAIQENFEIKKIFKDLFKNSDDSPMYQLQKYYPTIYQKIMLKEYDMFKDCLFRNIENGIKEGLYRPEIDKDLISKFYFSLAMSIHDSTLYTYNKNTVSKLEIDVLAYHTRAIATEKGLEILKEQLEKNTN